MRMATRAMAKLFGRGARVQGVAVPTPRLRRIRLKGPELIGLPIQPGDKIKLDVGEGAMRSYTPCAIDLTAGYLDILVHAHGDSAGSRWARALRPDDEARFLGPARSLDGHIPDGTPWVVFYGDETAAGLAEIVLAHRPTATPVYGALELAASERPIAESLGLDAVARTDTGTALSQHLDRLGKPAGDGLVFLSGEASAVLELRTAALSMGLARHQLRIKPYWSRRGKAHRKQIERTLEG